MRKDDIVYSIWRKTYSWIPIFFDVLTMCDVYDWYPRVNVSADATKSLCVLTMSYNIVDSTDSNNCSMLALCGNRLPSPQRTYLFYFFSVLTPCHPALTGNPRRLLWNHKASIARIRLA
eukprot:GHVH01015017.1.p1 GENE.GHVH01015017.1~~GHVH01015017.1.p1  ORF type:complete len:119 (+),score=4.40 GHVH01015017.1:32-388(+)